MDSADSGIKTPDNNPGPDNSTDQSAAVKVNPQVEPDTAIEKTISRAVIIPCVDQIVKRPKGYKVQPDVLVIQISHAKRQWNLSPNVVDVELVPVIEKLVHKAHQESNVISVESMPLPLIERGSSVHPRSEAQEEELKGDDSYLENNVEQALSHYRQAHSLNQKEPMYEFKVAASLKRINRFFECRKTIDSILINIDERISQADEHERLGKEYRDLHQQYDLAIEEISEAIKLDPSKSTYWTTRCDTRVKMAKDLPALSNERFEICDMGVRDAEEALKLNSEDAQTWNLKGCCHVWRNQKSAASQAFCKAIQLDPRVSILWANRGYTLMMDPLPVGGPPVGALQDIDKALEIDKKDVWAWEVRAIYWTKKGNKEEAKKAYGRAAELDPTNEEYMRLANVVS
eukprot:Protomagalhaensia_sp_Gyna_25__5149@NODE_603_length_3032_cov_18_391246_g466_i0_p2_GENE_NODE_603_length_3032_cov_18_391246_g466_i0NODE_603_length_3032_cov_18_391246_g466_i0_p2_ORF_typecomplete_len401_score86_57TPR_11/PF13414_6/7TPR_11/PF13414_6/0_0046TPR_11/PF13414_6/29TPR_11/PF13414_6/0_091TPR_11/PF13414_6/0_91TPR_11/PF13414_6/0_016TPR_19/PF14559_6/0_79TPR_19/PF14559_6/4_3TPR_19/PF14559_6/0_045TPR_19/PF14559_6/3e06TPR_16/PF13432_6/1_3e02TPR_16/PF13432_6/1_2TPR_16/PF13432_6/0_00069TPR_16/PF13432_6